MDFVIAASGPSLKREDLEYIRGKARLIVINQTYELALWADYVYYADFSFYEKHFRGLRAFSGRRLTCNFGRDCRRPVIGDKIFWAGKQTGLSPFPYLSTGKNSGYQAINAAIHLGAKRLFLLGYDMKKIKGKAHWHADENLPYMHEGFYEKTFLPYFETMVSPLNRLGIKVYNCNMGSAIDCFEKAELREVI